MGTAPFGVSCSRPQGPRRRWTATSPLRAPEPRRCRRGRRRTPPRAGPSSRRAQRAARRTRDRACDPQAPGARHHVGVERRPCPVFHGRALVSGDPDEQAGRTEPLDTRNRVLEEVPSLVAEPLPDAEGPLDAEAVPDRPVILVALDRRPERCPDDIRPPPAAAATSRQIRSSSTSVSPTSRKTARTVSGPGGEKAGHELEVVRGRHLGEARVALDDGDPATRSLDERRAVSRPGELTRVGGAQPIGEECLGGLDGNESLAIERLGDHRLLHALHGVLHRNARDDAVDALASRPSRRSITRSSTSGRAASWTTTTRTSSGTSASPLRTDSARVAPPVTTAETFDATSSSASRIAGSSHPGERRRRSRRSSRTRRAARGSPPGADARRAPRTPSDGRRRADRRSRPRRGSPRWFRLRRNH